jgi:hypothetical protein
MKNLFSFTLVLCFASAAVAQASYDHISHKKIRMDVSTAPVPGSRLSSSNREQDKALDRAERDTIRAVTTTPKQAPLKYGLEKEQHPGGNGTSASMIPVSAPLKLKSGLGNSRAHGHKSGWVNGNGR